MVSGTRACYSASSGSFRGPAGGPLPSGSGVVMLGGGGGKAGVVGGAAVWAGRGGVLGPLVHNSVWMGASCCSSRFFFFFFQHADTNVLPAVCQQFGFGPLLFQQENT